jgi:hypothetical protein
VSADPPFAGEWLAQRRSASARLVAAADGELRDLDDQEALRRTEALLSMVRAEDLPAERRTSSGLVAQQRRFHQAPR